MEDEIKRLTGEHNAAIANGLVLKARRFARQINRLEAQQRKESRS